MLDDDWGTPIVVASGILAGLGAAASEASPTGAAAVDAGLSLAAGMVLVAAFSRARRSTWLVASGMAALLGGGLLALCCSAVAVVVSFIATVSPGPRRRVVGAFVGLLTVQALFRMQDTIFHGATALWGLVAVTPVLISGYRQSRSRTRRIVRRSLVGVGAFLFMAGVGFAFSAAAAKSDLDAARAAADDGFDALRSGEQTQAAAAFEEADASFSSAQDRLTAPWARLVRIVPLASQQAAAVATVAEVGAEVSSVAAQASVDAPYDQVRAEAGSVDLAVLASMQGPVGDVAETLRWSERRLDEVTSSWLLPPVAAPLDDAIEQIGDARPEAELAARVLDVAPGILGGEGERRYLLAFTTPAETRFLGGFVGGYGVLTAADGKVELVESGRVDDLRGPVGSTPNLPLDEAQRLRYGQFFAQPFLQNGTATPDFATDAEILRALAPQWGLGQFDGVIVVDPAGLAGLLELTGPVEVEGLDQKLSADNAEDLLLRDQYAATNGDRSDMLTAASKATFEALTERKLPGPARIGAALGPVARQGHLLFTTFDDAEIPVLAEVGSRPQFPKDLDHDLLSVRMSNLGPNKIDAYLSRSISYDVTVDPATGHLEAVLEVTVRNDAPAGLPDYVASNRALREGFADAPPMGTALDLLSVYTPLSPLSAKIDGVEVGLEPSIDFTWRTWTTPISVPPGGETTLVMRMAGERLPSTAYWIDLVPQALATDDQVTVTIRPAPGWVVQPVSPGLSPSGDAVVATTELAEPARFEATFSPS